MSTEVLELPKRTRDVLVWITEQYTVNFRHLRQVINQHPDTKKPMTVKGVESIFIRLRKRGYVEWKRLLTDRPSFVYVTKKTLNELQLPFPEYEPQITQTLADGTVQGTTNLHKDYINQLRIYLEQYYGRHLGWVSERRIRLDQDPEPDGTYPHRADALAFIENQDTAIEVEKSKKGERRLEEIMLTLLSTYKQTYYFCTNPGTYGLARRVSHGVDPEGEHFRIVDWSEIS